MRGEYRDAELPESRKESNERAVLVEGCRLAREVQTFLLTNLLSSQMGTGRYLEVFLETASGNIYHIYQIDATRIGIVDARSNRGRRAEVRGTILPKDAVAATSIRVGQNFRVGKLVTSPVTNITAVTGMRFIIGKPTSAQFSEIARRETSGNTSNIKERFDSLLNEES